MMTNSSKKTDFITLYTDASFYADKQWARISFRGKCSQGSIEKSLEIRAKTINEAEMRAIHFAIEESNKAFPDLIGFFVNSDSEHGVKAFWSHFRDVKINPNCVQIKKDILAIIGKRWIRTKHVKAHTGKRDIRSYMNWYVDKMTRTKTKV